MLLWINGAFGAGKTQTAFELQRRLTAAHVADPEQLGYGIHRMLPADQRGDFQDRPQWRSGVVETLAQIDKHADVPVIVPMTLVDADYFDEVVGGLMGRGVDVRHYALTASVDTIHARLRRRVRAVRVLGADEAWAMQQADRCVTALREKRFATHVPTDNRTVVEVVEFIASHAHLDLVTPRLNAFRYQLHRLAVGVRHIRI
ncbi:MAG: AAA family ATPase [Gordonia amarae]